MGTLLPATGPSGTAAKKPRTVRPPRGKVRRTVRLAVASAAVVSAVGLSGCQRSLFRQADARTQFERFELMRGDYRPAEEPDVFGNPQPALRARLLR